MLLDVRLDFGTGTTRLVLGPLGPLGPPEGLDFGIGFIGSGGLDLAGGAVGGTGL